MADAERKQPPVPDPQGALPVDDLRAAGKALTQALMVRGLRKIGGRAERLTGRLNEAAEGGGRPGMRAAVTGVKELAKGRSPIGSGLRAGMAAGKEKAKSVVGAGGDGNGGGTSEQEAKTINIVEQFDVGLPLRVVYDQWTRFADYPSFTSKVESVEQESDEKVNWRAKIFLSHRSWEATIIEQVPDERIVWRSTGKQGYVDGTVTFHRLAPSLTRVLLVAEYHPDGFVEKTASLWRAQGRRLRLDFKHIKRHLMTRTILEQDEVEGWRGEIRDGEVVKSHEDALRQEREERTRRREGRDAEAERGEREKAEAR